MWARIQFVLDRAGEPFRIAKLGTVLRQLKEIVDELESKIEDLEDRVEALEPEE